MEILVSFLKTAAAVLGGILGVLLGEVNGMLVALLVFMAADYLTGVLIAIHEKKLSSEVGFQGLLRKVLVLMLVMVANMVDRYVLGAGAMVRGAVLAFYLANEGISLLENTARLGVPYPEALRNILVQLKDGKR